MNKKGKVLKNRGKFIFFILILIVTIYLFSGFVRAVTETVESINDTGRYSSIALDSNAYVHISYGDSTNNDLKYCNNTAGSWSCTTVDNSTNVGRDTSIAIDSNDKVHISHQDVINGNLKYCNNTAGSWSCITVENSTDTVGKYSSIAIDSNNKVHISYYNQSGGDLKYCNNTAGSWNCVALDTTGSVGLYSSIAIDSDNKTHISYYDSTNHNLKYCNNTAGSWNCTTVDDAASFVGLETSIAIDSNDKIHISYRDGSNWNLKYCNNTAGSWGCVTLDMTGQTGLLSSIAIDSNDKVHITYSYGVTPYGLKYCHNVAGSWGCIKLEDSDMYTLGNPNGRALAIKKGLLMNSTSFSDYAHISWYNNTNLMYTTIDIGLHNFSVSLNQPANNANISDLTVDVNFTVSGTASSYDCTVYFDNENKGSNDSTLNNTLTTITASASPDGSYSWYVNCTTGLITNKSETRNLLIFNTTVGSVVTETVESANDTGLYSSIALDSNGYVHISYHDNTNDNLKYCNNTEGSWSCITVDNATNIVGRGTSIAMDINDKVHISYHDSTDGNLKYCNNTAGSWNCTTVDNATDVVGKYPSIAIDSNNIVHISHNNQTGSDLKYCNNTAGSWNCVAVDTIGAVGRYSSIAIDSNDKVHISYYNQTGGDLKYCNNTAGSWNCVAVDSTSMFVGLETSIAVDSNDKVHISYRDGTNWDLKYCNNTAGSWGCVILDMTGQTGLYSSIAIDSNDKIHISYGYSTTDDLKYCNNAAGSWSCEKLANSDDYSLGNPNGRALAIKKGLLMNSTSFSDYAHISWYKDTDLMYTTIDIRSHNFSVSLNQPPNNTNISDSTPDINLTVSGTAPSYDCRVYFDNVNKGSNTLTLNNTPTTITAGTLSDGSYSWYVNCTAGLVTNKSETRNILIDITAPTITFTCTPSVVNVGKTVTCSCTGTDTGSGINTSATSYTANPSTSLVGVFTTTCSMTDLLGNSGTSTASYTVISGGGGVTEGQPTATHSWDIIEPEQPAEMEIIESGIDLTTITIQTTETVTDASLTVIKIDVIPQADIQIGVEGEAYQSFMIETTGIDDTNIENVIIEFKVNKTWADEQGIVDDINLYRKQDVGNKWDTLETTFMSEDSQYYYFSAVSPGFSTFMIFIGSQLCTPGEKRCFNSQIQLCLGNSTWIVTNDCPMGCKGDKCASTGFWYPGSLLFYLIVVMGTLLAVYLGYKHISTKKKKK